MKFHFIYLAAGYSKRFGSNKLLSIYEGAPMYRALLDRLVGILESQDCVEDITVVTQYKEIQAQVLQISEKSRKPIYCVINPDPSRGISSSLQCGITSVLGHYDFSDAPVPWTDADLISNHTHVEASISNTINKDAGGKCADHVGISHACKETAPSPEDHALICFVADEPRLTGETVVRFMDAFAQSGRRLGCVGSGGELGNPCVFAFEYIPELMELTGDAGGKIVLRRHPGEFIVFSDTRPEELEDIDYTC